MVARIADDIPSWANASGWPPESPRQQRWREFIDAVPGIAAIEKVGANQHLPPSPLSDAAFLKLLACFADPVNGPILRDAIMHIIGDSLVEVIDGFLTRSD